MAIKSIAFLLLLDYSGSMDQTVDEKPKIEMMRSAVDKLLSSPQPQKLSRAVVFGSRPEKGCNDIQISSGSSKELSRFLKTVKPGPFGKTPLSKGLEYIMERAVQENFENVVAITDGADSCKRDPCEVLKKSDQQLTAIGKKIELILIGLDLKSEKGKFSCFKDNKFSAITVNLIDAKSQNDIEQALLNMRKRSVLKEGEALANSLVIPADSRNKNAQRKTGSPGSLGQDQISEKSIKQRKELIQILKNRDKDYCGLVIAGAPDDANFEIVGQGNERRWFGQMPIELNKGKFIVFQSGQSIRLDLDCTGGEVFKIPWAALLDRAKTELRLHRNLVQIRMEPSAATQIIHGEVATKKVGANLTAKDDNVNVEFGSYQVNIDSPMWFKGKIQPKLLDFKVGSSNSVDVLELFKDEIKIVMNSYPYRDCVMRLTYPDGQVERHLIFKGQREIPIPKLAKVEFIVPQ